jgi:hypothetical protein
MMEMSLVLALSTVKLYVLMRPFSMGSEKPLLAIKMVSSLLFLFFLIIDFSKIIRCYINDSISCFSYYKPSLLRCSFKTDDRFGGLLKISYGLIVMFLLIIVNLAILIKVWRARRSGEKGGMKPLAVVSTVCWVFIISYLPFLLISKHLDIHAKSEMVKFASEQLVNVSIISNPIIYTLLYKSFARHIKESFKLGKYRNSFTRIRGGRTTESSMAAESSV